MNALTKHPPADIANSILGEGTVRTGWLGQPDLWPLPPSWWRLYCAEGGTRTHLPPDLVRRGA